MRDDLEARGFHPYLPEMSVWAGPRGSRRLVRVPMFSGYLFLNDLLDKRTHVEVRKSPGLVRLLGNGWDQPALVPDGEIEAIRRVEGSGLSFSPFPYLKEGQRVRIAGGPLDGVEGLFLAAKGNTGVFVVSIDLLQRSVAVQVDAALVLPA